MLTIENNCLAVTISPYGGEMHSIYSKETGIEYLWQGDPAYWRDHAPILFPFVGRLFEGEYLYQGTGYPMRMHGFVWKSVLEEEQTAQDRCAFILTDSPETLAIYPFRFCLRLEYSLEGNKVNICFRVKNRGENSMYCGFGGHPGFNLPLEEGLSFEDYSITFPETTNCNVVEMSKSVLPIGKKHYPLEEGVRLPLRHDLFQYDAVVLTDCPKQVSLGSKKGKHGVTVRFPDMNYVGFWHRPNVEAPLVCVEPWSVLPGREGVVEDITTMPNMTEIASGETVVNRWSIEVF